MNKLVCLISSSHFRVHTYNLDKHGDTHHSLSHNRNASGCGRNSDKRGCDSRCLSRRILKVSIVSESTVHEDGPIQLFTPRLKKRLLQGFWTKQYGTERCHTSTAFRSRSINRGNMADMDPTTTTATTTTTTTTTTITTTSTTTAPHHLTISRETLLGIGVYLVIVEYLLTPSLARRCLLVVWVYCLLFTVAPLLGWSRYTLEPSTVSCSTDWHDRTTAGIAYSLSLVVFCFLVQVAGLVICYTKIFTKSRRLYLRRSNLFPPDAYDEYSTNEAGGGCKYYLCLCEKSFKNRVEKHVLWVNLLMVLSFVTFWTPYALSSVVSIFRDDLGIFWYVFPTVFAKTSCMMNPLIYGLSHKLLYRELRVLLSSCCCCLCWRCWGDTHSDSLTDLQDMRRRQAEGTYDKEGIYLGKVRVGVCTCNGCVMSRREMTILAQLHKTTTTTTAATTTTANNNYNYNSSANSLTHNTCSIALVEDSPSPPPATPGHTPTAATARQTDPTGVSYKALDTDKALVTLPALTHTPTATPMDRPTAALPSSPHTARERKTKDKISVAEKNLDTMQDISGDLKAGDRNYVDCDKEEEDKQGDSIPIPTEDKKIETENCKEKDDTAGHVADNTSLPSKVPVGLRTEGTQGNAHKVSVALIETQKEKMDIAKLKNSKDAT
ncbi:uncharacterized protein LOC123509077 isoform X2 [Portunus trituberculatus]|uniref:uncharacterized protein LOC123509077 isoform X2 n=1 Tax=Portunus trituberculatus TaxID=210409 RepID=UPI001E1CFE2B|nr:uncharacterized protein LOC123509077 isoform X2 [Portunus trituberculatus]